MAEDEGTSRLHAVIGGFKRLQEKGLLCQPSPPNFEWRWSPDSGSVFSSFFFQKYLSQLLEKKGSEHLRYEISNHSRRNQAL